MKQYGNNVCYGIFIELRSQLGVEILPGTGQVTVMLMQFDLHVLGVIVKSRPSYLNFSKPVPG